MADVLTSARPGVTGKTGPGAPLLPPAVAPPWPGQGITSFAVPVTPPFAQNKGPVPNISGDRQMAFIPPLALFNDAAQWVNRKMFNRPLAFLGNGTSLPPLRAQYFTPPPIAQTGFAAGNLNLQLQLGNVANQVQKLDLAASNYFGS